MRPRHVLLATVVLVGVVATALFVAARYPITLDAPPPARLAEPPDTLPPMPPSSIEAPVTYDLDTAIDSLEAAVPRTYGDLERRIATAANRRLRFAFLLHRSPFRVHVAGTRVTVSADIEYSGRIWYDPPVAPPISLSCGTGDEPPRRARLTLESTASLTRDWGLRTRSRLVRLAPLTDSTRDRCRVTFLDIDVTERVLERTRGLLEGQLADFDSAVARWPVRPRFERVWRSLQRPVRLSDSLYLELHPRAAHLGDIGVHGRTAYANLRLVAAPRVVTGPRPPRDTAPLPPLELEPDIGRGARVLLDASFTYPVATAMLRKALVGRDVRHGRHRIRIKDVRIEGIGGGKVALAVVVSGAARGRLYFTGTPGYDLAARQVVVPDLDYDIGSARLLVRGYEWLHGVELRDLLRDKARLPDSAVVRRLATLAEKGMNRELPARGTRLRGRIAQAGVIAVRATPREIRVRALADAELTLAIDRAPSIPRPPELPAATREDDEDDDEP